MSKPKESLIVLDDDEDDGFIVSSPKISSRDSKLSFTQKEKSLGRHLLTKSKSLPAKTTTKSLTSVYGPSKRQTSWISSSFDGFESASSFEDASKKKKSSKKTCEIDLSSQQNKKDININIWIDKYKPQSETELAVHKKKIEDVRSWLLDHLSSKSNGILLLIGPVGVGKTATISALSKELDFEVQEWINPTTSLEGFTFGNEYSQSQLSQFKDFLLRSNKYPSLSIFGSSNGAITHKKVILIEDLPNLFYKDAKKLHEVLMEYRQKGRCPLILIISDSHHDDSNVHKLLPKAILSNLGVSTISFNPVANTSLVKTLNRIVSLESKKAGKDFSFPSKDVINELAQSSAGDIRTAINALQFSCQRGIQDNIVSKYKALSTSATCQKQKKESGKKGTTTKRTQESQIKIGDTYSRRENKGEQDALKAIGGKDTTIFLFRALGKILYCKRDPSISDNDLLPKHMSHLARNQPNFCPEDVVERAHLSSEMLSLYLHQNYLDFFSDIDDVVLASQYISDANMMSVEWMHRKSLIPYMSCIATRGLMYNSNYRSGTNAATSRGGWRPFHKPQWFDVNKKARDNSRIAKELFPEQTCPTAVLHSQIIPYLAITDVPLRTPGQISFVQQMGQYKKNKSTFRPFTEMLDEKDCGGSADEDEPTASQNCSQRGVPKVKLESETAATRSKNQDSQEMEIEVDVNTDEDIIIDDFEDDW